MPIQFACPHCGVQTNVSDESAGQTCLCARCGKPIAIPLLATAVGMTPVYVPQPRKSSSAPIVVLVVVMALMMFVVCGGILMALLLPAVQAAREAARRAQCMNNLKQIGLAMSNYQSTHHCFPPAYLPDKDGKPMHSWRVLLLPYIGEQGLYDMYDFDEPWDSPQNQALVDMMPRSYRCSSDASLDSSDTSYAMVVGPGCISDGPSATKMSDVRDGLSNTIMVVEVAGRGINWLKPVDWDTQTANLSVNDGTDRGIESNHAAVANVVFCDGSIRSLHSGIDPEVLKSLTTIAGDEVVAPNASGY